MLLIYSLNKFFCCKLNFVYFWLNFSKRVLYANILKSSSSGNLLIDSDNFKFLFVVVTCSTKLKNDSVFSSGDKFEYSNNL